jgi:methylenetetrahydrofolate dehydrogenase (NADP+)/methenyltetrahydrofolate cyclohydrolase
MQIIDGKAVATSIRSALKAEIETLSVSSGKHPGLAVVLVGDDHASRIYVRNKINACAELGIKSTLVELPTTCDEKDILSAVRALNDDDTVNGIIVQLPLPRHIDTDKVLASVKPEKDVDGCHYVQKGKLWTGTPETLPCTPYGCIELLKHYGIEIAGKEAVVVGRSNLVGRPLAELLLRENATVTICHSKTKDLGEVTRRADILCVAIGSGKFIKADMVKDGAVVIDVGMNRRADGKLTGDVDFASVEPKASKITPVPGGVGPMTIAMLMKNTLTAAKRAAGISEK